MQVSIKQDAEGAVLFSDADTQEPLVAIGAVVGKSTIPRRRDLWTAVQRYAANRLANLDRIEVTLPAEAQPAKLTE